MDGSLESPRGSLVSSGRTKPSALKHQQRMNSSGSAPSSLTRCASSKEQPRPHSLERVEPMRASLGAGAPSAPPVAEPRPPPETNLQPSRQPIAVTAPVVLPAPAAAPKVAHRQNLSDDLTLTVSSVSSTGASGTGVRAEAVAPAHARAELDVSSLDLEAEWCHFNAQKRHLKHAHSFQPGSQILQACTIHST